MPSPLGEGLTDTPINRQHRGEVPRRPLNPTIDLEARLAHHAEKDSSPCPLPWERGKRICRLLK